MYMYGRDQEDHERRIRDAEDREKRAFTGGAIQIKSVEEEMNEYSKKCQEQFYKNIAKRIRDKYKKEEQ